MAEPEPRDPRRPDQPAGGRRPMRTTSVVIWIVFGIAIIVLIIAFIHGAREAEDPDTREPQEEFQIEDAPSNSSALPSEPHVPEAEPLWTNEASWRSTSLRV